ncbi:MAG TPA: protein kinase [Terracidiphilus sp.]|nr:protein kinase [Terracidiphilus sp.]
MEQRLSITEQIFGEALEVPRAERSAFLDQACRGAPEVRRAVEDLLAENDRLSGFPSGSPHAKPDGTSTTEAGTRVEGGSAPLAAGSRLGRYAILEPLGAGGMGVVYRARDEKLERMVAIKMLAPGVLSGNEARRHFRREALALAKLNHPRIAAVYDVGEQDGADYIVMELVEGESLAAKLKAGALGVKEATAIALQVAEALEEAHEHGVIHRDLKPANVMMTAKGQAKVLDFGLARILALGTDSTLSLSETGRLLGTPLYMSPEQALGRSVDARTDLWSLGVVYYQCLTGQPPFRGESSIEVLHAITAETYTALRSVRTDAPPLAEHIVGRGLEKDCGLRYQRASDVATDLKRLMRDLEPGGSGAWVAEVQPQRGGRTAILAGAAALGVALALAWLMRPTAPPPRVTGITQLTHDGTPKLAGGSGPPSDMLTDGLRVYFQLQDLSQAAVMQVSTEGGEAERVRLPFQMAGLEDLSAAKSELLFQGPPFDTRLGTGTLWTMAVPGGQPRRVGSLTAFDATWAPGGERIYYTVGPEIRVARSDGSEAHSILSVQGQLYWIRFSHDGQRIRFSSWDEKLNTNRLWEARTDGSHLKRLLDGWNPTPNECCGAWMPDGRYFIFDSARGGSWNLWAIREKRDWWRKTNPEPVQLTVGQMSSQTPLPSSDGKKIFFIGASPRGELERYDANKKLFAPYLPGLSAEGLAFSRDGSRIAYVSMPEGALWQSKADGTDRRELTFAPMQAGLPRWSPDGTQIAFTGREPGKSWAIYVVPAEGGNSEQLTPGETDDLDPSWSPDGNALAYGGSSPESVLSKKHPIRILNLKSRAVTPLPDSGGYHAPQWSPDGRWLLAIDGDTRGVVLYDFSSHTWGELTTLPAVYPNWSRDGACVYFNDLFDVKMPVYRVCLKDRKPQLVVNLARLGTLAAGTFGQWTGLAPDGSVLAVHDISLEEIYALEAQLP